MRRGRRFSLSKCAANCTCEATCHQAPTCHNRRPRRRSTRSREFSWHGSIRRDATFFTPARETRTSSFLKIIAEAHAPRRDVCRRSPKITDSCQGGNLRTCQSLHLFKVPKKNFIKSSIKIIHNLRFNSKEQY